MAESSTHRWLLPVMITAVVGIFGSALAFLVKTRVDDVRETHIELRAIAAWQATHDGEHAEFDRWRKEISKELNR